MVNFGYGPGVKGWDDKKAPMLAQRLKALLVTMEKQRKFDNIRMLLQKLIISLRTAIVLDEWKLDKQQTSHDDILDSFRLALCNYEPPRNLLVNHMISSQYSRCSK